MPAISIRSSLDTCREERKSGDSFLRRLMIFWIASTASFAQIASIGAQREPDLQLIVERLPSVPVMFHSRQRLESGMASTITAERISELIAQAPAWAKIGLTMPNERLREDAQRELARHVYSALFQPINIDTAQLRLPL